MGRVSHRKLNSWVEEGLHEVFWEHLAGLTTPSLIKEFLESLLSHTEKVMLAKRLAIAILLARGFTYEDIDQTLKVSKSTVMTVHRQLMLGAPGYQRAIKSIKKRKSSEEIWDKLEEILLRFSPPAAYGSPSHQSKSRSGKALYKRRVKREYI